MTRRLGIALTVVLLAGCGQGGYRPYTGAVAQSGNPVSAVGSTSASGGASTGVRVTSHHRSHAGATQRSKDAPTSNGAVTRRVGARSTRRSGSQQPTARASAGSPAKGAVQTARSLLADLGIRDEVIRAEASTHSLAIAMTGSDACQLPPGSGAAIPGTIEHSDSWVRAVSLTATGEALPGYVTSHCHAVQAPSSAGKLLFEHQGGGIVVTPEYTIDQKDWTVTWVNYGGFFSVHADRNGKQDADFGYSRHPQSGKWTFHDGPGRFKFSFYGPSWKVAIYEGG